MSEAKETEFNGKPVMQLIRNAEDKFGFQFGVKKARLVIEHYDAIKAFVEKYDRPDGGNAAGYRDVPRAADRAPAAVA